MDFRTPEDLLRFGKRFPLRPANIGAIVLAALLLVASFTVFYSVGPDEKAVVLFLGKYVRTTGPGLHMKLPFGVERAIPVKVERIFKEEFGFRTTQPGIRTQYSPAQFLDESLMLTGDLNALIVNWIVQFRVSDPVKLLFGLRDPVVTIRVISEAAMRELVGDYSVDEVLTIKRAELNVEAKKMIQTILDSYDSGIHIETVNLQDVTPPARVRPAFNEVNEAKQEKERVISESLQQYNKVIPQAQGQAQKIILEAQGYAIDRVNRAKGEANRFLALLAEYRKSPDVTRRRLYLEAMQRALKKPKEKFVIDESQKGILPLMDLRKGKDAQ